VNEDRTPEEAISRIEEFNHPLRMAIHDLLLLKPSSAAELSRRLDVPVGRVRYQLGRLREAGIAELRELRPKRGMVERVYAVRPAYIRTPKVNI